MKRLSFVFVALFFGGCLSGCGNDPWPLFVGGHIAQQQQLDNHTHDDLQGEDGIDGEAGADGIDGIDGSDGLDGKDGVDGQDGSDGVDGQDGSDGGGHGEVCRRVSICHNGHTIEICEDAAQAHVGHEDDYMGECDDDDDD